MSAKNSVKTKSPRSAVLWPDKVRGGPVSSRLRRLPPAVVGPDPSALTEIMEAALKPLFLRRGEGMEDFIAPSQREAFRERVRAIRARMSKMIKVASGGEFGEPAAAPFGDLDPVIVAAESLRPDGDDAVLLGEAYRLLNTIASEPPARTSGMAAVIDPVFMLTRAVVVYRHQHGMTIDSKWNLAKDRGDRKGKRFADEECTPISETAVLLCAAAKEWNILTDHSTLRGALDTYLAALDRENRGPEKDDALPIFFDVS